MSIKTEDSLIMRTVARVAVPLMVLLSGELFLQGHNLPGGGFIAGALAALAGAVNFLAHDDSRLVHYPWWRLAVWGLLVCLVTGTVPLLLGYSFLTHAHGEVMLPVIGKLHLSSSTIFDLGIYAIVVGTLMTVFTEYKLECD